MNIKKKKIIVLLPLINIITLSACTDKQVKNPFTKNKEVVIEDTSYKNPEIGVSFDFDINLTPMTKELYEERKDELDKYLEEREMSVINFQKNLDNVDLTLYDFKEMDYITRLSYACNINDQFDDLDMDEEETLKILKSTLKENMIEGSDFMEEADFRIGRYERVPYVKYSFPDEVTGIKVVAIQTLIVEDGKIHSLSFFTDGDEYVNSIAYLHEILDSFTIE